MWGWRQDDHRRKQKEKIAGRDQNHHNLIITASTASPSNSLRCRCQARSSLSTVLRRGSAPCEVFRLGGRDHGGSDLQDVSGFPWPTSRKAQIRERSWRWGPRRLA